MKTVMKKIFSLMLVAVLLVSAVPFAASAEEVTKSWDLTLTAGETYSVDEICKQYYDGTSTNYWVQNGNVRGETFVAAADRTYTLYVVETVVESEPTTVTCNTCGETYTDGTTHTCPTVTCETCKESYTKGTTHTCPTVTCETCKESYTKGTTHTCPTVTCETCKETYTKGTAHTCPTVTCETCKESYTKGTTHTCSTETTEPETCNIEGCTYDKGHTGHHSTVCKDCLLPKIKSSAHNSSCDYYESSTNNHSLKVWARIWVHETEHKTILLDTISNLSANDKIYQVVAANTGRLEAKFPSGYQNIHWLETVYRKNSDNAYKVVGTDLTVGDEDDVYVNLYSSEQLVVVNVHTSKSYSYDLSVRIEGFRTGDTVTYEDVLKAVKKYYNVSSMSIYTYEEMERYVAGKDANKTVNFIAGDREDPYEVFIQGSRKSSGSTYTYTADSSNPKTGDAIFAPAIIMGASFTCLAVLFFLNKKRAY